MERFYLQGLLSTLTEQSQKLQQGWAHIAKGSDLLAEPYQLLQVDRCSLLSIDLRPQVASAPHSSP